MMSKYIIQNINNISFPCIINIKSGTEEQLAGVRIEGHLAGFGRWGLPHYRYKLMLLWVFIEDDHFSGVFAEDVLR